MSRVPVILIEDRYVNTEKMGLPRLSRGYEFVLEYAGKILSPSQYTRCLEELKNLHGFAIVLLDLGFHTSTLEPNQIDELHEWLKIEPLEFGFDPDQKEGLYLGMHALLNNKWQGELIIASSNLKPPQIRTLLEHIIDAERNPKIRVHIADDVPGVPDEVTDKAINYFLKDFNVIEWFLQPPKTKSDVEPGNIGWLHGQSYPGGPDYHEVGGEGYNLHIESIKDRFPSWAELDASAKALMYSTTKTVRKGERHRLFPAYALRDFFGQDMSFEGLPIQALISLPTAPGLPFLVAVQQLIDKLREGKEAPVRLVALEEDGVALGIEPVRPCIDLIEKLQNGPYGETCKAFLNALEARIEVDVDINEYPFGQILQGVKDAATPLITESFVGVSWKTQIKT